MFRVKSPPLKRRSTFPVQSYHQQQQHQFMAQEGVPDLMTDCSNSASNSDEDMMVMDQDMEETYPVQASSPVYDDRGFVPRYDYEYGMSGSGGIGFGPGADEDDDFIEEMMDQSSELVTLRLIVKLTRRQIPRIQYLTLSYPAYQPEPFLQCPTIYF